MATTTAAQTLCVITHPMFAQGYQRGRDWYFCGEVEGEIDARMSWKMPLSM